MSIIFYVGLFLRHLLSFTRFHFSCHFETYSWTFIVHKLRQHSPKNQRLTQISERDNIYLFKTLK